MVFYFCSSSIDSKIRGKVASIPFEQFHKHSAGIITAAVFGNDANGTVCAGMITTILLMTTL